MLKKLLIRVLFVLGVLVLLSPILAMVGWFFQAYWGDTHPEMGRNVSQVDWLPPSASNVSFFKSYSFTAYEFNTTEKEVVVWAGNRNLAEIENPISILRYNFRETYPQSNENTATVVNGLFWETPPRGNGGGTRIAFDRDTKTAYYQDNPR